MKEDIKQLVAKMVKKHHGEAIKLSDEMAANPEIAFEEFASSRKMVEMLKEAGFEVAYPFANYETAFCGVLKQGEGPKVAILVEYDALPEIGHACGHNWLGAVSILSALALNDLKENFCGSLYVIGTPAEEYDGAKIGMSDAGIFDDMDFSMLIHGGSGGYSQANMDALSLRCYVIEFTGEAAHSSTAPWDGHNALIAATKFIDLLDARRQSFTPDMRANSIIIDGGVSTNVIPNKAVVRIEFRAESMGKLDAMDRIVTNCINAAALALDCKASWVKGLSDFSDMVCLTTAQDAIEEIFKDLGETVRPVDHATASTDMGNVSYHCPALQPIFAISKETCALHTKRFEQLTKENYAYEAMDRAAQSIVRMVLRVFNDKEFMSAMKTEFEQVLNVKKGG